MVKILLMAVLTVAFTVQFSIAENIYVDNLLQENCVNAAYNLSSRRCGDGSDGRAFKSIQEGVATLKAGDTLTIRGGYYEAHSILISLSGNPTLIEAYAGEIVTIHNPYVPQNISDGKPTFSINTKASNIEIKKLILTGEKSQSIDEDYGAFAIGNTASEGAGNSVTVENCKISGFAHCGVKGAFRWVIRNCIFENIGGTKASLNDWHDHHIYSTGQQTLGNEAIIERNYFGECGGAAIHLYSNPSFNIIRYNIINGRRSSGVGLFWGILLSGSNHKIIGNTFYNCFNGLAFYKANCQNNIVVNNLFFANLNADIVIDYGGGSHPKLNNSNHNLFGSNTSCSGCIDKSSEGGENYFLYIGNNNINNKENPFKVTLPSSWKEFSLSETSVAIDKGTRMGLINKDGIDPNSITWPPSVVDQNANGHGWEIGAFVYPAPDFRIQPPKNLVITDAQ